MTKFLQDLLFSGELTVNGAVTLNNLAGAGSRMVVVDSTGVVSTQAIVSGAITGTGTIGQVSFWSETSTQTGSNNFFWDTTNNRLGIGTTTPSGTLNVKGDIISDSNLNVSGAFYNQIRKSRGTIASPTNIVVGDDVGGFIAYGYEGGAYRSGAAIQFNAESVSAGSVGMRLRFFTGAGAPTLATERLRITAAGNVLISTTTDAGFKFDVNGTTRITGQLRLQSTITNGTFTYTLPSATGTLALISNIPTVSLQVAVNADKNTSGSLSIGTTIIKSVSASTYSGVFFDYVVKNGTNVRVGTVVAITNGTTVESYETLSNDIGTTTALAFTVTLSSGNMNLNAVADTTGWTVIVSTRAL